MSSNQRPTGVRIISSQNNQPDVGRRRGEPNGAKAAPTLAEEEQQETAALRRERAEMETLAQSQKEQRSGMMMMGIIFLVGCALGGAALAFLKMGTPL